MRLLGFLVIGLIVGWLAGHLTRGRGFGLIGDLIVGVVGAGLGGHILGFFGVHYYGLIGSFISALIGAVVLVSAIRLIKQA